MVDPAALRLVLQETLSPYADKRRTGESHCSAFARRNYDGNAIRPCCLKASLTPDHPLLSTPQRNSFLVNLRKSQAIPWQFFSS
jgi:hypothetical protein